jgi:hypothetical protein
MPRRASFPTPSFSEATQCGLGTDPSPAKRKRPAGDDDLDILNKSPRNDRAAEGATRTRNNVSIHYFILLTLASNKYDRAERAMSESLVSVTSYVRQARDSKSNAVSRASVAPATGGARQCIGTSSNLNNPNGRDNQSTHTPNPTDAYHLQRDNLTLPSSLASTIGTSRQCANTTGNGSTSDQGARNQCVPAGRQDVGSSSASQGLNNEQTRVRSCTRSSSCTS